jgi:hypothetical protein
MITAVAFGRVGSDQRGAGNVRLRLNRRRTGDDATNLLEQSPVRYRSEHRTMRGLVILHKTSSFSPAELEGFQAAADNERPASTNPAGLSGPRARTRC